MLQLGWLLTGNPVVVIITAVSSLRCKKYWDVLTAFFEFTSKFGVHHNKAVVTFEQIQTNTMSIQAKLIAFTLFTTDFITKNLSYDF